VGGGEPGRVLLPGRFQGLGALPGGVAGQAVVDVSGLMKAKPAMTMKRWKALRTGRRRRKPHRHPDSRRPQPLVDMTMIDARPAEVADRSVPGHWEGDLVRHEALHYRAEVRDLRRRVVAAA